MKSETTDAGEIAPGTIEVSVAQSVLNALVSEQEVPTYAFVVNEE